MEEWWNGKRRNDGIEEWRNGGMANGGMIE